MIWGRRQATTGYWAWSLAATVVAMFAWGASERPPFDDEKTLFQLTLASLTAASVLAAGLERRWSTFVLGGIWAAQLGVLLAVVPLTSGSTDVRIAPPLYLLGVAGELAGLMAIGLSIDRQSAD